LVANVRQECGSCVPLQREHSENRYETGALSDAPRVKSCTPIKEGARKNFSQPAACSSSSSKEHPRIELQALDVSGRARRCPPDQVCPDTRCEPRAVPFRTFQLAKSTAICCYNLCDAREHIQPHKFVC
jgi:hypothetical protein